MFQGLKTSSQSLKPPITVKNISLGILAHLLSMVVEPKDFAVVEVIGQDKSCTDKVIGSLGHRILMIKCIISIY